MADVQMSVRSCNYHKTVTVTIATGARIPHESKLPVSLYENLCVVTY